MLLLMFFTHACNNEIEIQTSYPFDVEVMPVPKAIANGEKLQIRCRIKAEQIVKNTKYFIRYFQSDGEGKLIMENGVVLNANDSYLLQTNNGSFYLYYVSTSTVAQSLDVWIYDSNGNEKKLSFQFTVKS
ncbi:TraQ conjugal transfer family protein [Pedobacter sp. KLB.chiD]|uniref:TraQ conjugal transfer family protein n=1 Tax=Pedobacter sp. KLB.chiD TaxID=3387402 RepID=UPI0039998847